MGTASAGSGRIHLLAANSEVQTTSRFSTLKVSDLIWAFWMSCWRCWSAESGSSMNVTFSSGWAAFHSSMLLFAAPEASRLET